MTHLPTITLAGVAAVALEYHKQGRLQATLAQENNDFVGQCFNLHPEKNNSGDTVHCVIGAWLNENIPASHLAVISNLGVNRSLAYCSERGLVGHVKEERITLSELQKFHDDQATNPSADNFMKFMAALEAALWWTPSKKYSYMRLVDILYYEKMGLSQSEIASKLDLTKGQVSGILYRMRKGYNDARKAALELNSAE